MCFDKWDIVSSHYCFYCDYHGGQSSDFYKRMCRIGRYYKPSPLDKGYESLSENGREIYDNLKQKHNV